MKKLFTIIMVVIMFFSFETNIGAETASTSPNNNYTGIKFSSTDELSEKEKMIISEKIAIARELDKNTITRAVTKISIPGSFTIYQQEKSYYCAPACVKSMLKYITGTVYTQNKIARGMGTDNEGTSISEIAPYLNDKQDAIYYVRTNNPSQSDMCSFIHSTISYNEKPALMCIVNTTGANWHYPTAGHSLVVNAIYSDKSTIQFADPMGGMTADWPYYYLKTATVANSVCKSLIW